MWQEQEPNVERVRQGLAQDAGCDPDELAITRNASEALQIAQLGIDLQPGDEVVTTTQDYGRMLDTWEQRVRRDRITLTKVTFPVPPPSMADLTHRLERALSPRTKVLHFCHTTNLTGQVFPVADICKIARARGIQTIVDGAHAFGHFPYVLRDLGCDYYGTSLHKWLLAPIGTGFLYVRRERIPALWPLTPAAESKSGDIRKFEEVGTHPAANHNAVAEARVYHHTIGVDRKIARLRYLRDRWMRRLAAHPKARILTSFDPAQSGAIGNLSTPGIDPARLASHLYAQHRIIVTPIKHAEFEGLRITPNVYTTLEEVDTFASTVERLLDNGLPATA
jgi:isopenicillin-N epimerase